MSELVEELLALSRLESGQANAEFHRRMSVSFYMTACAASNSWQSRKNLHISLRFDETPLR